MTYSESLPEQTSERTYSGVSLSERASRRRTCFIEAGIELFGTIGYNATTMRKLVALSGLTNRYFYESFATLEDLLIACYEHLMEEFRTRLQRTLTDTNQSSELRVTEGLTCFFEAMQDPKFAKITHSEVLGISARVDATYNNRSADFAVLLMASLQESDLSHLDEAEKDIIGAALVGAVTHAGMVWVRSDYAHPIDVVINATRKIFLGTLQQMQGQ